MSKDPCEEVGDPARFYFAFPADNDAGEFLDINEAVRRDGGKTSVCGIYLTHMLGRERADAMMADKKLRGKHLVILPVSNFQNKGLDAMVLRYSAIPALDIIPKALSTTMFGEPFQALDVAESVVSLMAGTTLATLWGLSSIGLGRKSGPTRERTALLIFSLILIGVPIAKFTRMFKAASNNRDRLQELEAKRMGYTFQRWQEAKKKTKHSSQELSASSAEPSAESSTRSSTRSSRASEKPRTSAAGARRTNRRKGSPQGTLASRAAQRLASERAFAIREREFRRLQAQSPEAIVAGGADPRTFRTERARLQKKERSSSRSASVKKSARVESARSRRHA